MTWHRDCGQIAGKLMKLKYAATENPKRDKPCIEIELRPPHEAERRPLMENEEKRAGH